MWYLRGGVNSFVGSCSREYNVVFGVMFFCRYGSFKLGVGGSVGRG